MKLIFSKVQPLQMDEGIMEVVVFPNLAAVALYTNAKEKAKSNALLNEQERCVSAETFQQTYVDLNTGALYKLRAVLQSDKQWKPRVRCGITGDLLAERSTKYDTYELAIVEAALLLREHLLYTVADFTPQDAII